MAAPPDFVPATVPVGSARDVGSLFPSSSSNMAFSLSASCGIDPSSAPVDSVSSSSALMGAASLVSRAPVDLAAQALAVPADVVFSDLPRIGLVGADSEFSLPPPCRGAVSSRPMDPLDPVPRSVLASGSDHLPPLRPAPGSLLGPPVINQVQSAPCLGSVFTDQDFPPLALQAGDSKSKLSPAFADSSVPPVGLPCSSKAADVDSLSGKPSWVSLVQKSPVPMKLSYIKPVSTVIAGNVRLSVPPAVALHGASIWENTIVGFFLDKLPFSLVQSFAHRLWDSRGLSEVLSNGNGFFFFKFSGSALTSEILNGGPWYFGGRPIFLKAWKPGMNLSKVGCKKVPIWAHFYNVPLEFWSADGLSHIASAVGFPLFADNMTATLKRISYARICIEICIDDSLPNILELEQEDGSIVEIRIEYNWVPKKCSICCEFGHLPKNCKKGPRQSWVPKSSAAEVPPPGINSGIAIVTAKSPASKDKCLRSSSYPAAGSSGSDVSLNQSSDADAPSIMINSGVDALKIPASLSASDSARLPVPKEGWLPCSAEDPTAAADDPIVPADDPLSSGVGGPFADDDPFGGRAGDPIAVDDPSGTGAGDPIAFDDPNALGVPMAISSVSPVGVSSLTGMPVPSFGSSELPSPTSSSSSTPLLARKLIIVDEVERKLGRKKKDKRKPGSSGSSRGNLSQNSK